MQTLLRKSFGTSPSQLQYVFDVFAQQVVRDFLLCTTMLRTHCALLCCARRHIPSHHRRLFDFHSLKIEIQYSTVRHAASLVKFCFLLFIRRKDTSLLPDFLIQRLNSRGVQANRSGPHHPG